MEHANCPQCGKSNAKSVGFTWWGGAIGPRVLSHVKCQDCGKGYNGKTGKDNTTGIVIYSAVVGAISLFLVGLLFVFVMTR